MGRDAQRVGQSLEDLIVWTNNLYWSEFKWWIQHNGIAGVWHKGNKGRPVFAPVSRTAAPDFYGCMDGHFIAFDAKTTANKTRWSLHKKYDHQYLTLYKLAKAKAITFFAVEERKAQRMHLLRVGHEWPQVKFDAEADEDHLIVHISDVQGYYPYLDAVYEYWLPRGG